MKMFRFFGLFRHRANYLKMRREIKSGDRIVYIKRDFYDAEYDIRSDVVRLRPPAPASWVETMEDDAVAWRDILEWEPRIEYVKQ